MDMLDASLNSSSEFDSPNTKEKKRFRCVGGEMTDKERSFLIRNGYMEVDEEGEYHEVSTIMDTDRSTDDENENLDPQEEPKDPGKAGASKRSSVKSSIEDSLGRLFRRSYRNSDSKSLSGILSPLAVNSTNDASLKDEECLPKQESEERIGLSNELGATDKNQVSDCPNTEGSPCLLELNSLPTSDEAGKASLTKGTEFASALSTEMASTAKLNDSGTSSTSYQGLDISCPELLSANSSANSNSSVYREPRASPSKLVSLASTPSCSEIEDSKFQMNKFVTPLPSGSKHFGRGEYDCSYIASTPAVNQPTQFAFSPDDNQSLLSIQCPTTYSSPSDLDTPPSRSRNNAVNLMQAMLATPADFRSPASHNRFNKTEIMDISYGDVADFIEANASDTSAPGSIGSRNASLVNPNECTKAVMETPVPPQIIEQILELEEVSAATGYLESERKRPESAQNSEAEPLDELASSVTESKGIDAVSPATIPADISLTDTTDSFAEISLDDISNVSLQMSDTDEGAVEEDGGGPNESFRTCTSAVSTASYNSCNDHDLSVAVDESNTNEAKSIEELDDTITIMEKLLLRAEELEEKEAQEALEKSNLSTAPMTTPKSKLQPSTSSDANGTSPIFATPKSPLRNATAEENFATPTGPAPRTKRISVSKMESQYFSPKSRVRSPALPPTPPRATPVKPPSPLKQEAPKVRSPKVNGARSKTPTPRLKTILDSPRQASALPKPAVPRLQNTPGRKPVVTHPIVSPVANYIYSLPPPVQVQRMIPPPKVQTVSPKKPANIDTRIPKPKLTLPRCSDSTESHIPTSSKKPGRETINALLPPEKKGKELPCNVNYIGPNGIKAVNGSFTTHSKLPTSASGQSITPVAQRHLGMRDINNESMVTQQHAPRKFCPERFGFRSYSTTPRSDK